MSDKPQDVEQALQQLAQVSQGVTAELNAVRTQLAETQAQHAREMEALRAQVNGSVQLRTAVAAQPRHTSSSGLPTTIKLEKPETLSGAIDGDTVSSFIHKLDLYFDLAGLRNEQLRATFTVSLQTNATYTWFRGQQYRIGQGGLAWATLKADLLGNFYQIDYGYHGHIALVRYKQQGNVKGYMKVFRLRFMQCTDAKDAEAQYRFTDGLLPEYQRFV